MPPFLSNRLTTVREVCLHQLVCSCLYARSALKRDKRACCHCVREGVNKQGVRTGFFLVPDYPLEMCSHGGLSSGLMKDESV